MRDDRTAIAPWLKRDVSLAAWTTLELGGPARFFTEARSVQELGRAFEWAKSQSVHVVVLGGGSNVLVPDHGVDALVCRMANQELSVQEVSAAEVCVRVGAGSNWDDFVAHCVTQGWGGLECLSGIPGTVGATPVQNVGAYGQEVSERIESVTVMDRDSGALREVRASECAFSYRHSAFKSDGHPLRHAVIVEVCFVLTRDAVPAIKYPELRAALETTTHSALTLADVRDAVLALRKNKSMVIDPLDENRRSVGSFFTNPIVSREQATALSLRAVERRWVRTQAEMPQWSTGDDRVKLSAAWLIERSGWRKGTRVGNVGISSRHSLALVHHGGGTTAELIALAESIRASVLRECDIKLAFEPVGL
jgi:UDP-N-acetylmuramate dehydrogenase